MSDKADKLEQKLQGLGLNAPRVTPTKLIEVIQEVHFFTAAEGVESLPEDSPLHLLTICVIVLENGFTVLGKSACASPENFIEEIGREIAYDNALEEIWPLEGYLLKQKLSESI